MVEIIRMPRFDRNVKKIKDKKIKEKIKKKIKKIIDYPQVGEFLRYRKGERKIYIKPFRLLYSYDEKNNRIYLIDFDRKDKVYKNNCI